MGKFDAIIRAMAKALVLLVVGIVVALLLMVPVVLLFGFPLWYMGWIDLNFFRGDAGAQL